MTENRFAFNIENRRRLIALLVVAELSDYSDADFAEAVEEGITIPTTDAALHVKEIAYLISEDGYVHFDDTYHANVDAAYEHYKANFSSIFEKVLSS